MATLPDNVGHGGGLLATVLSSLAFLISGLSFYMSALQKADLEVYVPPVLQYARDGGGDVDVFAIPVTIANNGANTGAVLAMELLVESVKTAAKPDAEVRSKIFYSAFLGEHPREADQRSTSFAPIAVPARATFAQTIRFYPRGNPLPRVVEDAGEYKFTLKLTIAEPQEPGVMDQLLPTRAPAPIVFTRVLPYLAHQHLNFRRGTSSMHAKDWQPTTSAAR